MIAQAPAFVAKCWEFYKSELAKNPNLKNQLPINMKLTQAAIDSELSENPFLAKIQRLLFINTTDKTLNTRTNEMYELLGAKGQMEYELCTKALKSLGVEKREKRVDGVKGSYFVGVRFK
ncbi:MAG: hypothetical protein ACK55I_06135, partial [bacterium]